MQFNSPGHNPMSVGVANGPLHDGRVLRPEGFGADREPVGFVFAGFVFGVRRDGMRG